METVDPRSIVRDGYDKVSYAYRGDACDLEQSGYGHWLRRLRKRLPDGGRVLDLGCGCGVPATAELAKRHRVTGVDISPVQIERARALVPGATFECADMTEVAFDDGSFDAIVAFYSLINLPVSEQPAMFRRMAGWLAPGGWLLAIVGQFPWTGIEPDFRGVHGVPMYWGLASVTDARAWCADAGLSIVEEGVQPPRGNPGFSVFIARKAG